MPGCPGLCWSIVSASAYLGYTSIKLFPNVADKNSALLPIAAGITLLVIAASAAVLYFKAKKEAVK